MGSWNSSYNSSNSVRRSCRLSQKCSISFGIFNINCLPLKETWSAKEKCHLYVIPFSFRSASRVSIAVMGERSWNKEMFSSLKVMSSFCLAFLKMSSFYGKLLRQQMMSLGGMFSVPLGLRAPSALSKSMLVSGGLSSKWLNIDCSAGLICSVVIVSEIPLTLLLFLLPLL